MDVPIAVNTDDAFAALGLTPDNVGNLDTGFRMQVLVHHVARSERKAANGVTPVIDAVVLPVAP